MKEMCQVLVLLLVCACVAAQPPALPTVCGYQSCPQYDEDMLNVHIVPHTHDDVGWLKTVDQYYFGSRNGIQVAGVQYILDTVVSELYENSNRRFIYVESFFFFKWWNRQPDAVKYKVKHLVSIGSLQFTGGAWSMNDEAAAHYQSIVDQFTYGLSRLHDTFGECGVPRVGWQIDPFGHSREFASLLSDMGYDGLFLGRIDYQDKMQRLANKSMEMIWRGDDTLGASSDIFTGVLYNTYSPPPGFCYDILCSDQPIIDDLSSPEYNVDEVVRRFLGVVKNMSVNYRTNNVLVTMGGDFQYQDATTWFSNLDKLIKYTNLKAAKDKKNIKLYYSTPQCYLKAVNDSGVTFPKKQDDFFPYASDSQSYWTGYFTSRPTTKYFERLANTYLQMVKQLLGCLVLGNMIVLDELKSAMGIMQHHDAITGTEKQHVAHDYERILSSAIEDGLVMQRRVFSDLIRGGSDIYPRLSFANCRLNESRCFESENSTAFVVTIYNILAWNIKEAVRIPVVAGDYEVYAPDGKIITSQIVKIPNRVKEIPTHVKSNATHEVVFIAHLKPVSYKNFYIQKVVNGSDERVVIHKVRPLKDIKNIKNWKKKAPVRPKRTSDYNYETLNVSVMKDAKLKSGDSDAEKLHQSLFNRLTPESKENPRGKHRKSSITFNDKEEKMLSNGPLLNNQDPDSFWETENMKLSIDEATKNLHLTSKPNGLTTKLQVKFGYYIGHALEKKERPSGAYIFRPAKNEPEEIDITLNKTSKGPVVSEISLQTYKIGSQKLTSTMRFYEGFDFIENDWIAGPIDITDETGKEYVVNYVTSIVNNGEFYTDSNGRQLLKRKLGKRPQYNITISEPVAGNYYPVTNQIAIENDNGLRFSVLTDRSEGGSSLKEGHIELMLHRRLLYDDSFGVGEALNETGFDKNGLVVRGRHRLFIGDKKSRIAEKKLVKQFDLQPLVFVSNAKKLSLTDWLKLQNCFSFVNELPDGLHLLTVEPWGELYRSQLLIRLENYLDANDRDEASVNIDLNNIFKHLKIESYNETTLAANQWKDEFNRWTWKDSRTSNKESGFQNNNDKKFTIEIKPKQIRTFILNVILGIDNSGRTSHPHRHNTKIPTENPPPTVTVTQ